VLDLFRRKEYVITVDARPGPRAVQQEIRRQLGLPPLAEDRQEQPGEH
jgi:adenylate kinase